MISNQYLVRCSVLLLTACLLGACGDDLSELDALARKNIGGDIVEVRSTLSDDQVVSSEIVISDANATGQFFVDIPSNLVDGSVVISPQPDTTIQEVQLRKGFGGQNGALLLNLIPDPASTNTWIMPANQVLAGADVELLLRGGLYVLVTTSKHVNGEIRGQLLQSDQDILVNPLSADQLVTGSNGSTATATSYLSVDLFTGEVQGMVRHSAELSVTQISMHSGLAGLEGDMLLQYEINPDEPASWRIPEDTVLSEDELNLLEQAKLYLQIYSDSYPEGELRGQLHSFLFTVKHTKLKGMTLIPEVSTNASGNAFVTLDNLNGNVDAIVRITDITPTNVILFRMNSPNTTETGKLLYSLEQEQDYWQLPDGVVFETKDFVDIANGKLLFIVTSTEYPLGEIGGLL